MKVLAKLGDVSYTNFITDFLYRSSFIYDIEILHNLNPYKIKNLLPKVEKTNFIYINIFNSFINNRIIFSKNIERKVLYHFLKSESQNGLLSSINFALLILEREYSKAEKNNINLYSTLLINTISLKKNINVIQNFINEGDLSIDQFPFKNISNDFINNNEIIHFIL